MNIIKIKNNNEFPPWLDLDMFVKFMHESIKPYNDTLEDTYKGVEYAFSTEAGKGGFLMIAEENQKLLGALVMLKTGMQGYIPENLLLMVAVEPCQRGKGTGKLLVDRSIEEADGDVALHVEYDNPAKKLYERVGFTSKYAEMRYIKK